MSVPNSNNSSPRMHPIYRFFGWCAGANLDVLKDYPEDQDRYFGIGTMVFMTGIFAFMSSSYAFSQVFQSPEGINYLIVGGAAGMWALFIFLLDRYFVSSMRKGDDENAWGEWKLAIPRLALAGLIGIVISHPFELRLFRGELLQELAVKKRKQVSDLDSTTGIQLKALRDELITLPNRHYSSEGQGLDRLDSLIQLERATIEPKLQPLRDWVQCECNGACGTKIKGMGPACEFWVNEVKKLQGESNAQIKKWENEKIPIKALVDKQKAEDATLREKDRNSLNQRIKQLDSQRIQFGADMTNEFSTSILAQSQILSEISNRPGIATMKWLIIFLFIMLETAPILVKLLSKEGAYEAALARIERLRKRDAGKRVLYSRNTNTNANSNPNPSNPTTHNEDDGFWRKPTPPRRDVDDDDD